MSQPCFGQATRNPICKSCGSRVACFEVAAAEPVFIIPMNRPRPERVAQKPVTRVVSKVKRKEPQDAAH